MSYVLFFDSGLGGLSVMKEAIALHPEENYIYYADNIHLPYGDKTLEEIRKYTIDAISGVIDAYPVKAVVIACNTATSAACRPLRQIYPDIPVIGIEPAIKPAAETFSGGNIGVLATEATLRQPKFLALTEKFSSLANIIPIPCPGLVNFVESGIFHGKELEEFLAKIRSKTKDIKFDGLVLGCTHYPFLKDEIQRAFDCNNVFDGGRGTVNNLFRMIKTGDEGKRIFINSAKRDDFTLKANELLQKK